VFSFVLPPRLHFGRLEIPALLPGVARLGDHRREFEVGEVLERLHDGLGPSVQHGVDTCFLAAVATLEPASAGTPIGAGCIRWHALAAPLMTVDTVADMYTFGISPASGNVLVSSSALSFCAVFLRPQRRDAAEGATCSYLRRRFKVFAANGRLRRGRSALRGVVIASSSVAARTKLDSAAGRCSRRRLRTLFAQMPLHILDHRPGGLDRLA
jgi:hypothetical protein